LSDGLVTKKGGLALYRGGLTDLKEWRR